MKRVIIFLLLIVLTFPTSSLMAIPLSVFLEEVLGEAIAIDYVEIVGYEDSTYTCTHLLTGNIKTYRAPEKTMFPDTPWEKYTTNYWPVVGEKVLIVMTKRGISLFGVVQGGSIRFWSPYFTFSKALFFYKSPAMGLTPDCGVSGLSTEYETCWDGCLLPINKLFSYGRKAGKYINQDSKMDSSN